MASVDASHQRAELYRHGTDWDIVENNLKEVRNSKINFFINCTVGATNVWHVSDLQRYLIEQNIIESDNFHMNLLVDSKMMSIKILPNWFKKQIVQKIFLHKRWLSENRLANSNWDDVIKFMISEDHSELLPQYISYNRELDKIRNQQITKVFPELQKVFDN
jgi:sulfatase maturation enzyme AslB (radical SAM superfamily)